MTVELTEYGTENGGAEKAEAETEKDGTESVTRRGFLRTAAAGTAAAGTVAATGATSGASAQEGEEPAQTFEFDGEVSAWRGRAPSDIEGEENPTLELEAGTQYRVVWENVDGAPHDFVFQNDGGQNVVGTDQMSDQGATLSVTFTATPEMTQYICTIHPTTMVGDVEVTGTVPGGEGDAGIALWPMLILAGVVAMFLSPVVFALFLFSRRRETAAE